MEGIEDARVICDEVDYQNHEVYDPDQDDIEYQSSSAADSEVDLTQAGSGQVIEIEIHQYEQIASSVDMAPEKQGGGQKICNVEGFHELAPYLFLTHIPGREDLRIEDNDAEFGRQLGWYPYLCSLHAYRCLTAYKQDNPAHPRYLVVQEFKVLEEDIGLKNCPKMQNECYKLKRKQAKTWWRVRGRQGKVVQTDSGVHTG
ncbi:hypothetical protein MMC30_002829 [Trapelia coarctata]|nr:hypothetical protein [Trapelia coarctata]